MGKKQHFVPKFLLRHFSSDPKQRVIDLFYLPESRVVRGSIRDQAYRKNLYGSDQKIEDYLMTVETTVSEIIGRIVQTKTVSLTPEEDVMLKHFVNLQISRTPEKISRIQNQFNKMMKIAFRHDPRIKNHLNDFDIEIKSPYHFMIGMSLKVTPALFDLKVSLLENASEDDIVIGQHPAVIVNPLLYLRKWPGSQQGMASKGALILLPISPRYVLALYDRMRYGGTQPMSKSDVDKINMLQFCYTTDCVYFYDTGRGIKFDEYKEKTETFRASDKNIVSAFEQKGKKDRRSEIIMATSEEPPIRPTFDFIYLRVIAMHEELGPTMDISREGVKEFMDIFEDMSATHASKEEILGKQGGEPA